MDAKPTKVNVFSNALAAPSAPLCPNPTFASGTPTRKCPVGAPLQLDGTWAPRNATIA